MGRQQAQACPHKLRASRTNITGNEDYGTKVALKRQILLDDALSEDHLLALPPESRAGIVEANRKRIQGEVLGTR